MTNESENMSESPQRKPVHIPLPIWFLAGDKEIDPATGKTVVGKIPLIPVVIDSASGKTQADACLPLFSNETAARLFAENKAAHGARIRVAIKEQARLIHLLEMVQADGGIFVAIDPLQILVGQIECLEIQEVIRILRQSQT